MAQPDLFKQCRSKLEWAAKHIGKFEWESLFFFQTTPYEHLVGQDERTGERIDRVKLSQPLPTELSLIVDDVLYNLRASLDCLASAIAKVKRSDSKNVVFPFAEDAAAMDVLLAQLPEQYPLPAVPLFQTVKPYKGGNELLYTLKTLRCDDYACLLMAAWNEKSSSAAGPHVAELSLRNEYAVTDQAVSGSRSGDKLHVIFGDIPGLAYKPVTLMLTQMQNLVDCIIYVFEAEFCSWSRMPYA